MHPSSHPWSASPTDEGMSEGERLIRYLYRITADQRTDFDEKVRRLLRLGCTRFDLEIGILAQIGDGAFVVREFLAPDDLSLQRGLSIALGDTFGAQALEAGQPLAVADIATAHVDHPVVQRFGLRAYLGCVIQCGERDWGTLSFSSRRPRTRAFRDADTDALQLMATWIGGELQRRQSTEEMRRLNDMLLRYKDALEAANRQLREQNRMDELTEIANRRTVLDELRTLLVRGARSGTPVSVIAIDADNFKAINDGHGHEAGDRTLKRIARVLVDLTREGDLVGRMGGEEFIVLLPNTDRAAARPLAERLRTGVQGIRGLPMPASISLGVASYLHPGEGPIHVEKVLNRVLVRADQAMYRAKHGGKNRVCMADD